MTTREMTIQEHASTAHEFLRQSDEEFAEGEHLQASEKLYGAANHALTAVAKQRGWACDSHRAMKNVTQRLEQEYEDPFMLTGFIASEKFHRNFFHNGMEDYEIALDRPVVHDYVEHVLATLDV